MVVFGRRGLVCLVIAVLAACGGGSADGTGGGTTATPTAVAPAPFTSSAEGEALVTDLRKRIQAPYTRPFVNHGWYYSPSEGGTGFVIEAQGDVGFVTFFMYEEGTGKPIWYYGSGIFIDDRASADGQTFFGELFVMRGGRPVHAPTQTAQTPTSIGSVLINFSAAGGGRAVLPGGRAMNAQRFDFNGLGGTRRSYQPETGLYWNPGEGGRGYAIEVQNDQAFMAMFHYNDDGSPTWNVVQGDISTGVLTAPFELYEAGQTLTSAYRTPSRQTLGPYTLSFRGPCAGQVQRAGVPAVSIRRFRLDGNGLPAGAECRSLETLSDLPGAGTIQSRPLTAAELAAVPSLPQLQPGDGIFGTLDNTADADNYAVRLTAGVPYDFQVEGSSTGVGTLNCPFLELFDSGGAFRGSIATTLGPLRYTPSTSGVHVLRVSSTFTLCQGSFVLSIIGGAAAGLDASPIRPQASFAGTTAGVLHGRDTGSFTLSIGANGTITGNLTMASAPTAPLSVSGTVQTGGAFQWSAGSLTASGYIGPQGDLNGSWNTAASSGGLLFGEGDGTHVLSNRAPSASFGYPATFPAGTPVTLPSVSRDLDGDPLTHRWQLLSGPAGSTASLANANTTEATLSADIPGDYVIILVVNDGRTDSSARVSLRALGRSNLPPLASAGTSRTVALNTVVTLDGSGSTDPDNDSLRYHWAFVAQPVGSNVTFADEAAVQPTFAALAAGVYVVRLTVNDGQAISSSEVAITVPPSLGSPPVAQAPRNVVTGLGNTLVLTGRSAATILTNPSWHLTGVPAASLLVPGSTINSSTFVIQADVPGTYTTDFKVAASSNATLAWTDTSTFTAVNLAGNWTGPLGVNPTSASEALTIQTDASGSLVGMLTAGYRVCGLPVRQAHRPTDALPLLDGLAGNTVTFSVDGTPVTLKATSVSATRMSGTLSTTFAATDICGAQTVVIPWTVTKS